MFRQLSATVLPTFLAALVLGCSDSTEPTDVEIRSFGVSLSYEEAENGYPVMVVGEEWGAHWSVEAYRRNGVVEVNTQDIGEVRWESSNPGVIRVTPVWRGAHVKAIGPGIAYVTATVLGFSDTIPRIKVVPEAMPFDTVRVTYDAASNELWGCSTCTPRLAESGELQAVVAPAESAFVVQATASRNSNEVYLSSSRFLWNSTDSAIAYAGTCRAPELDADCAHLPGPMRAWVSGRAPGKAVISLTVRNKTYAFEVEVVER